MSLDEINNDFVQAYSEREDQLRTCANLLQLAPSSTQPTDNGSQVLRSLSRREVETLEQVCRCTCTDWSKIRLSVSPSQTDVSWQFQSLLSDTRFDGTVILDMEESPSRVSPKKTSALDKLPNGVHSNLLISDSIISLTSCRVYRNSILSNTFVGPHCTVLNCGTISCSTATKYGVLELEVGAESGGGRNLTLTLEHTMLGVCHQLRTPGVFSTTEQTSTNMNILSESNLICDTSTVENVYLYRSATIQAATCVKQVTMLPFAKIGNSCTVSNCLLQWNSEISDHSSISQALLMEQSHCGPSSIVAASVLGPDVHVSCGEIHASVLGPNTNAHHQSLVISVLWPLGRGNVGYGANVGSNHTGRLPDQETAAGEGTFWGLSTVIKMPLDLSFAPYSIVAAGTTLAPQRICMPFSLILTSPKGDTEIIPGWVLQSSPYTIARSEKKFATRRKAKRHDFYTGWKIIRQEIVEMCVWARNTLQEINVKGIGMTTLTDRARNVGLKAYTACIQRYALYGLLQWLLKHSDGISERTLYSEFSHSEPLNNKLDPLSQVEWPTFPWDTKNKSQSEWDYQKSLLQSEFPLEKTEDLSRWIQIVLNKLIELETDYAKRIHKSKHRDDARGSVTIPGYAQSHISADQDPVIVQANEEAKTVKDQVTALLKNKLPITTTRSRL